MDTSVRNLSIARHRWEEKSQICFWRSIDYTGKQIIYRVSHGEEMPVMDPDFVNRRARIYGKGRKEREIYFSPQASLHIRDYLNERKDSNPALLVGVKAPYERLSIAGIQYLLKDIQSRDERLSGLKISPHTFRRTCGTDMINRGAPVEMVKEKLGHAKVDTTLQCYAQIGTEAVRDADRRYGAA